MGTAQVRFKTQIPRHYERVFGMAPPEDMSPTRQLAAIASVAEAHQKATVQQHMRDSSVCPACGANDVEGDDVGIEGNQATQQCGCFVCGAEWLDRYTLVACEVEHVGDTGG